MSENSRIQTFFPKCTWNVLPNRSHVKRIEIIPSIFSNHNSMKLEINYRKKNGKITNVETKQHGTKNKWIMKKSKRKSENILREMKTEAHSTNAVWYSKSSFKMEVYSDTGLP